jgi:cytochrome c oxidase subunit 3
VTNEERRYHLAVWIVIASEALLFAGLFALYTTYRAEYPALFDAGVTKDIQWIGGVNTLLLLTSSFAIAWSIHCVRSSRHRAAVWSLVCVLVLGLGFLALKGLEWTEHVRDGIVPRTSLFFTLYYAMTGLHALHVIVGLGLVLWVFIRTLRGGVVPERHLALVLVALYWHFVDAIWVFLWPMFYLMRG